MIGQTQPSVHAPRVFSFVTLVDAVNDDGLGVPARLVAENLAGGKGDIGAPGARVGHDDNIDIV